MTAPRVRQLLARFARQRVLVVGDVMLDHFIWGKARRLSPEAPVPVVEVTRETEYPGGAANVSRNLRALGADVTTLGLVGTDAAGDRLRELLAAQGLRTDGLLTDARRPTSIKTRVVAQRQQVVRFDRERVLAPSPAMGQRVLAEFERALAGVDAVIFEDYAKGLLTQALLDQMQRRAKRRGIITAADPNARHWLRYRGLTAVTPNRAEAFAAAGLPATEPVGDALRDRALLAAGARLLRRWRPANLLVTLGEHGMCLFRPGQRPHHIPTVAREVFDVSGAGDTAIAVFTLALAGRATAVEAAALANHAAGVVVGKVGTAICTPAELARSCRQR